MSAASVHPGGDARPGGPPREADVLIPRAAPADAAPGASASAAAPPVPRPASLKSRAVRGTVIWGIAYAVMQVIRAGSSAWLSHLVLPWMFGVVTICLAVQKGVAMFSELGIRPALIQSTRADDDFVNTAWTLGAIRGVGIWLAATSLAWPVALFYGQDALVQMVPVLALTAVLTGLESTRVVSMNRELREGPRALMEVGNAVVTRATMIAWAYAAPSPWALIGGTLAGGVFSLLISHLALPGRVNRFRLQRSAVRAILKFGSWIFIGTVIAFLGQQLDKFMLGKLDGLGMLGVYAIALTVTAIPQEMVALLASKILYPVLAEVRREDPGQYARRVRQIRGVIVPCGAACVLGVVFLAPWFFTLVYAEAFHDAAWIAPLACVAAWFAILNSPTNRALLALAETRALAVAGAIKVLLTAAACAAGYSYLSRYDLGVAGFVLGVAVGAAGEHACNLFTLRRHAIHLIIPDALATLTLAGLALAGWYAPRALDLFMPATPALVLGLLIQAALVGVAGLLALRRVLPMLKGLKKP